MKRIITILLFISIMVSNCRGTEKIDKTVVREFDINRYIGTWYEIARYDHWFERNLVGVTANYSFRDDGKIRVINRGYKNSLNGKLSETEGKAKIPDKKIPAKIKVSFFLFFYSDYFVIELDNDYKWAVVGSSSDDYLWILSRTPQLSKDLFDDIISRITKRGYDSSKLIIVEQVEKQDL